MAISVAHHNAGQNGGATSFAIAFATNPTAGNWLGIGVTWTAGTTITSVTSSIVGDVVTTRPIFAGTATSGQIFYVENTLGGACTITVHFSATTSDYAVQLVEVSGLATASSFDADIPGANSSATTVTSGSFTTAQASEFAFCILGDNNNCQTFTAGAGFTLLDTSSCVFMGQGAEYQIYSSTQTGVTAKATYNTSSTSLIIRGAVFKSSASAFQPDEDFWCGPMPPPIDPNIILWQ